ncbi:signal peptidase I SipW [Peribacillus alkalitolerans]|uniref:signal peptidase I SipW n=1 Tax=Peribacillus alkalitolerans TaxID=1550385 RepID=UPI0013D17BE3|nr:signal peptidase I [Peribacillus alkalitolerans]
MKKAVKISSNILYGVIFTTLLVMVIMVISSRVSGGEPQLFGYQFKTVLSGSMEPTFKTGSIILVKKPENQKSLKVKDVISFRQSDGSIVTHRIIDVIKQGNSVNYQTKGDNNKNADTNLVIPQNIVAVYSNITIPFIGYFLKYASSSVGTALLLIIPGFLLLGYAGLTIRTAIKEIELKMKPTASDDSIEQKIS